MRKKKFIKSAVLAMLLASMGGVGFAAPTGTLPIGPVAADGHYNYLLTDDASVSNKLYYYELAAGANASTTFNYSTAYGFSSTALANYSTAIGSGTSAGNITTGEYSTAVGVGNLARAGQASAIGYMNTANDNYTTAVGAKNTAAKQYSTAIGYYNAASAEYTMALGTYSSASGIHSTAIGVGSEQAANAAVGASSSAFGYKNNAGSDYSQAFGSSNSATSTYSTVLGSDNQVTGTNAVAFGYDNKATGNQANALGTGNLVSGEAATGIGYSNTTNAAQSTAMGFANTATGTYSMALGQRNTAAGPYAYVEGANNISGGYSAVTEKYTQFTTAIGFRNKATGSYETTKAAQAGRAIAIGVYNTVTVDDSVALGQSNDIEYGEKSVAFGYDNSLNINPGNENSVATAFGSGNKMSSVGKINNTLYAAVGFGSKNEGWGVAVGYSNDVLYNKDYVSVGSSNEGSGIGSLNKSQGTAVGYNNAVHGTEYGGTDSQGKVLTGAVAIGTDNAVYYDYGIAVGYDNTVRGKNAVAIGGQNIANGLYNVTFGYDNKTGKVEKEVKTGEDKTVATDTTYQYIIAMGKSNTGRAAYSVLVGNSNSSAVAYTMAFGYKNESGVVNSHNAAVVGNGIETLFGAKNVGKGNDTVAFGYGNTSGQGWQSDTYGVSSHSTYRTVAIGNSNEIIGYIGTSSSENHGNSVGVGYKNTVSQNYSGAFGVGNNMTSSGGTTNDIKDDALYGKEGNFSGAYGYKNTTGYGYYSEALGALNNVGSSTYSKYYITALGVSNTVNETKSIAVGYSNSISSINNGYTYGYNSAFGRGNTMTHYQNNLTFVGFENKAQDINNNDTTVIGHSNVIDDDIDLSTYVGYGNGSYEEDSSRLFIFGKSNSPKNDSSWNTTRSTLMGQSNTVYDATDSVAIGTKNSLNYEQAYLLGESNSNSSSYQVAIGYSNAVSSSSTYQYMLGKSNGSNNTGSDYSMAIGTNNYSAYNSDYLYMLGSNNQNSYNSWTMQHSIFMGYHNREDNWSSSHSYLGFLGQENVGYYSTSYKYAIGYGNKMLPGLSLTVGSGNTTDGDTTDSYTTVVGAKNQTNYSDSYDTKYSTFIGTSNKPGSSYDGRTAITDIGYANTNYGSESTALGQSNSGSGYRSSALGYTNTVYDNYSTAVGFNNRTGYTTTNNAYNTAIGAGNYAGGYLSSSSWYREDIQATAVGAANKVKTSYGSAFGYGNTIYGVDGYETDDYTNGLTQYSAAIGQNNEIRSAGRNTNNYATYGVYSYALGKSNRINNSYGTAIGYSNTVGGTLATSNAQSSTPYNVAIGAGNTAGGVYYSQYYDASTETYHYNSYNTEAVGFSNLVSGYDNLAMGYANKVSGNSQVDTGFYELHRAGAIGQENTVKSTVARSYDYTQQTNVNSATGEGSYVLGRGNTTTTRYSYAIGADNTVGGSSAYYENGISGDNGAIGIGNTVGGVYAYVSGETNRKQNVYRAYAVGSANNVTSIYASAVGYQNTVATNGNGEFDVNYSAALGQENVIRSFGKMQTGSGTSYNAVGRYSYVIGYQNTTNISGATALGFANTLGVTGNWLAYENNTNNELTAIGTGNVVGGRWMQSPSDTAQKYQIYKATAVGTKNTVAGVGAVAVGYQNEIQEAGVTMRQKHLDKTEVNRSAALGKGNIVYRTLDKIGNVADKDIKSDVYDYAVGVENKLYGAGNLAVGMNNKVGGEASIQVNEKASNTAIGAGNTVGGMYFQETTYNDNLNGLNNTAAGFTNWVIGQNNTAIGTENTITYTVGDNVDTDNKTQDNTVIGQFNIISKVSASRMNNVVAGESNTIQNAYEVALGFNNTVGGGNETGVGTETMYHVAVGSSNIVGGTQDGETSQNESLMTAVGTGNKVYGKESVAIGARNIAGVDGQATDVKQMAVIGVDSKALTRQSLAVGVESTADTEIGTVAVGVNDTVSALYSSAFGYRNTVTGTNPEDADATQKSGVRSIAVGTENTDVSGLQAVVAGSSNTTNGSNYISVFGVDSTVTGDYGVVFGSGDTAAGGAIAAGYGSEALGEHSLAMGYHQTVTADASHGVAVGSAYENTKTTTDPTTSETTSTTYYFGTTVSGVSGSAFGVANLVSGAYATAAGAGYYYYDQTNDRDYFYENTAIGDYSAIFGYLNKASAEHSLAVGSGLVEMKDGVPDVHYNTASGVESAALGYANEALAEGSLAGGSYSRTEAGATGATAIGSGYVYETADGKVYTYNTAGGEKSTALGYANSAQGNESVAAGYFAKAAGANSTALGTGILKEELDGNKKVTSSTVTYHEALGAGSTALGYADSAVSDYSSAMGSLTKATGVGATAAGSGYTKDDGTIVYNEANGEGAVVFGYANIATGNHATALGSSYTDDGATYHQNAAYSDYSTAIGAGNIAGTGVDAAVIAQAQAAVEAAQKTYDAEIAAATTEAEKQAAQKAYNEAIAAAAADVAAAEAAVKTGATAIGTNNIATGQNAVAIGSNNTAKADHVVFTGTGNTTVLPTSGGDEGGDGGADEGDADKPDGNSLNGIALADTTSHANDGTNAVAIGNDNVVPGYYGLAFGDSNTVYNNYGIAIGTATAGTKGASGGYQIALGYGATASAEKAVAIGYTAKATAENSIAFGTNAQATFANSVAIGTDSVAVDSRSELEKTMETTGVKWTDNTVNDDLTPNYRTTTDGGNLFTRTTHTVSFGESSTTDNVTTGLVSRLTNVAEGRETKDDLGYLIAGEGDTDAINVKQLKKYIDTVAVDYEHRVKNTGTDTLFTTDGSYITTKDYWLSTDFDTDTKEHPVTHGESAVAYGYLANAKGLKSEAFGADSIAGGENAIALAGGTTTDGKTGAMAIGKGSTALDENTIAIGASATEGETTTATSAGGAGSIAIGSAASTKAANTMAIGAGSVGSSAEYTISVGSVGNEHRIVNVADATVITEGATGYDGTMMVNVNTLRKVLDTMKEVDAIVEFGDGKTVTLKDGTKFTRSNYKEDNDHWVATTFGNTDMMNTHGKDSAGYGYSAWAKGENATSVGYKGVENSDDYNLASGKRSQAFGIANKAVNSYATAAGSYNVAGDATKATDSTDYGYQTAVGYGNEATGNRASALGYETDAKGTDSLALGNGAQALTDNALAIGTTSTAMATTAYGTGATAIGFGTAAYGEDSLSLGSGNVAVPYDSASALTSDAIAVGNNNVVSGTRAAAFGYGNATNYYSSNYFAYTDTYGMGVGNTTVGNYALAMGSNNAALMAEYATVLGYGSGVAGGARAFAGGVQSTATGNDSLALGMNSYATGASSTAVGYGANALSDNATAIGYESTATDSRTTEEGTTAKINTVSFGHQSGDSYYNGTSGLNVYDDEVTSRLIHVAEGIEDTDAINVSQLRKNGIVDFDETYLTEPTKANYYLSTDFGGDAAEAATAHGTNATAYGYLARAAGENSAVLGYRANAEATGSVALGSESVATGENTVSVGHKIGDSYYDYNDDGKLTEYQYTEALTRRITNVAEGNADTDLVNVALAKKELKTAGVVKWDGVDDTDTTQGKHWLSTDMTVTDLGKGENSVAYGYYAEAVSDDSSAFGYNAQVTSTGGNSIALGAESVATTGEVVSIGHAGSDKDHNGTVYGTELTRKIIHVADGENDTDLVNVRTLKLADPVKTNPTGDSRTDHYLTTSDATVYKPGQYSVSYGLGSPKADGTATGAAATGDQSVAFGYNAQASANNSVALGQDSVASKENTVSLGHTTDDIDPTTGKKYTDELTRRITNVAAGEDDTDLVNYKQLKEATAEGGIVDYDASYETSHNYYLSTKFDIKNYTPGVMSSAYGYYASATGARSAALGYAAQATVDDALAIGSYSVGTTDDTISVGHTTDDIDPTTGTNYTSNYTRRITNVAYGVDDQDAISVGQLAYSDPVKTNNSTKYAADASRTDHYLTTTEPTYYTPGENSVSYGLGRYAAVLNKETGKYENRQLGAVASGANSVAFGYEAVASAANSVALGSNSVASVENTISVGHTDKDTDPETNSKYDDNLTRKITNVWTGSTVSADGKLSEDDKTALVNVQYMQQNLKGTGVIHYGYKGEPTGDESTMIVGKDDNYLWSEFENAAQTPGLNAVAYGNKAYAKADYSAALGYNSTASAAHSVALGEDSVANAEYTVSVGHKKGDKYWGYDENKVLVEKTYESDLLRTVTGLAFGEADSDAVSVAQLAYTDPVKTNEEEGTKNHWLATPFDSTNIKEGENSVGYGYGSISTGKQSVAFGYYAAARAENSVAIGAESATVQTNTVSFGHKEDDVNPETNERYNTALNRRIIHVAAGTWDETDPNYHDGTDLINKSQLDAQTDLIHVVDWGIVDEDGDPATDDANRWLSTDFGASDVTHGVNSTAYGHYANAQANTSSALGYAAVATAEGSVALGYQASASEANTISVGHTATDTNPLTGGQYGEAYTKRITNVAEGSADTDIVNKALLEKVDPVKTNTETDTTNRWLATPFSGVANDNIDSTILTPGENSAGYGFASAATGKKSVAFGTLAYATGENSVALGAMSAATEDNVVSIGYLSSDINPTTITANTPNGTNYGAVLTRKITNVEAGRLAKYQEDRTANAAYGYDAITVAQVKTAARTSGGVVSFDTDYENSGEHWLNTYIKTAEDGSTIATHDTNSAAYGYLANVAAAAEGGTALGYNANVTAANATAVGANSVASVENTVSFGHKAGETDAEGNAYDSDLTRRVTNVKDGVIDETATDYTGTDALTVGQLHRYYVPRSGTTTDEDGNTHTWVATIHGDPVLPGQDSASYGGSASATGKESVAFGYNASATQEGSVALGSESLASSTYTISIGNAEKKTYRRLTNLKDAVDDYDAITYQQLQYYVKGTGIVDSNDNYLEDGDHWLSTDFEETVATHGKNSMAFGYKANATAEQAAAFGYGATATAKNAVALGDGSVANVENTISVGSQGAERKITNVNAGKADTDAVNVSQLNAVKDILTANGMTETSNLKEKLDQITDGADKAKTDVATQQDILKHNGLNEDSNISGRLDDVATRLDKLQGGDWTLKGDNPSQIGYGNTNTGNESTTFGYKNEATGDKSTAVGSQNVAVSDGASAYGNGNTAGDARDPSKTGQTAYGTNNIVTGQDATGGGSTNTVTGDRGSAYGYNNHVTGSDALAYGSNNEARGDGSIAFGNGAAATGNNGIAIGTGASAVENSVAIGNGAVANEEGTVSFGDSGKGTTTRIIYVSDGVADSDVATYGQVKKITEAADSLNVDKRIEDINTVANAVSGNFDRMDKDLAKVGAGAAAMAALHPLEYDPDDKVSFAVGYGNYQGTSAMAVGTYFHPNEITTISLGGSVGGGDNLVNTSISFALGKGPSGLAARSKNALVKQVNEQDEKIAARDAEIAKLKALIWQLEAAAETEEQKAVAHEMVIRSEQAELEELRSMAQQLVATANAETLRSIVKQLSANDEP